MADVQVPDYNDPRLKARVAAGLPYGLTDDNQAAQAMMRQVPIGDPSQPAQELPVDLSSSQPPQPRRPVTLKDRIMRGVEGAAGGAAQEAGDRLSSGGDIRLLSAIRQQRAASELEKQRIGGEQSLESQREAYARPEQQAQIAQQAATTEETGARTEQQRLASKILQRRLELMQGAGGTGELPNEDADEQALLASAYATGDPKTIESAVARIYGRRNISGMAGPSYNQYDQNAPGGASRVQLNRMGQPMATEPGVVVPGLLPKSTTSTQLVPTTGGGMSAVPKTSTTGPVLPATPGASLRSPAPAPTGAPTGTLRSRVAGAGAGGARPVMNADGTPLQPRLPAQEERAQDTATMVIGQLPRIKGELQSLRADLGPLGGRVMELGQAVGTTNPNYIKVRADTDAAVSAFSVIHFGARGNWQWLQDFRNNMDAGHLNFPDLVAGWSVLEQWLRAYSTYGEQGVIQRGGVDAISGKDAPGVSRAQR